MNTRPNILLINADQLRYDCLGFNGHPLIKTPHLDGLAKEGIQFTSAYTPFPVCCPARQTLLSGVMPEQHGGLWNYDGGGSLPIPALTPERAFWVNRLKESGYRTAYLGKWHVHPEMDPTRFGFEGFTDPWKEGFVSPSREVKYPMENNPWPEFPIGYREAGSFEESHTHVLARKCIERISEFETGKDPWHIRLDFPEPHLPCIPAEPFASMVPPKSIPPWGNFGDNFEGKPYIQKQQLRNWCIEGWSWNEWAIYLAGYLGMIAQLDHALGRVFRFVEESGLIDKTMILFTTDHGDAAGSHRMMDKHYVMYEEETHVPLVIRWDGVVEPGRVCNDFISHFLDIPVTLLDILDLPVPDRFQGRSFRAQLEGMAAEDTRPFAFSAYNGQQFGLFCQRMIRDRKYKYIWNAADTDECYDLQNDPHEMYNLAFGNESSALCREYRHRLYDVFAGLKDPLVSGLWTERWLSGK